MGFQSTKKERQRLSLTLYMGGFAAIKEVRKLVTESIIEEGQFLDVAERLEPDSIVIRGLGVLEQVYDPGILNSGRLLESYIGEVVAIHNMERGKKTQMRLLGTAFGIIGERVDTGEILINPSGELILPPLPERAKLKPSITWKIPPAPLNKEVAISYITQGVDWETIYTLEVEEETFKLTGWVNIHNQTGMDFHDVQMKLIAGQVNRQGPNHLYEEAHMLLQKSLPHGKSFEEHSFADKHIYALPDVMVLLNGQSKKVRFVTARSGPWKKAYKIEKTSKHAKVNLVMDNAGKNGLNIPLPKGIVKVYERDVDGELEFTGEDAISHTPPGEKLSLTIGEAFDVISKSWETAREKRSGLEYVTHRYELKNRKQENIRIDISHALYEQLWEMESSSHDYEVKNTDEVEFSVRVAAGKSAVVEFTYKVDKQ